MASEASQHVIHLDLDRLAKIARHGGTRAAWFLGLAVNSMSSSATVDHRFGQTIVPDDSPALPIELVPADVTPEMQEKWKLAFVRWTGGSCLQDLLVHYCWMLDEAHDIACLVSLKRGLIADAEALKRRRRVQAATGIRNKLQTIFDLYGIESDRGWWAADLYTVRNILGHGFGVVRDRDVDDNGILTLKWLGLEGWARGAESNQTISIKNLLGVATTEAMILEVRQVQRMKVLRAGDPMELTPLEFAEIFYSVSVVSAKNFIGALADFLHAQGLTVNEAATDPRM